MMPATHSSIARLRRLQQKNKNRSAGVATMFRAGVVLCGAETAYLVLISREPSSEPIVLPFAIFIVASVAITAAFDKARGILFRRSERFRAQADALTALQKPTDYQKSKASVQVEVLRQMAIDAAERGELLTPPSAFPKVAR